MDAAVGRDLVLGTAGHIDHGKTALVRALTGVDADRLPEEKARGLTIDLGFASLDLGPHRLAIVDHGRVLACGRMDDLIALAGTDTVVTATFDGPAPPTTGLDRWPGVHRVETDGSRVRVFTATADGVLSRLVRHGQEAGRLIRDATTTRPRLDDVFLTLTGREYRQ